MLSLPVHDRWDGWGCGEYCLAALPASFLQLVLWRSGRTAGHAVVLHSPCSHRTAALVCNAMRAQRCGDDSNARIQLTKALKAAHTHLGNTQMVAQVGCAA